VSAVDSSNAVSSGSVLHSAAVRESGEEGEEKMGSALASRGNSVIY